MPDRILVLAPLPAESLAATFPDAEVVAATTPEEASELAAGASAVLADFSGRLRVTAALAERLAETCRLVQVPAAGTDSVDLDACAALGIPVASCAGLNTIGVAEWAVWATIDALRQLSWADRALRAGRWEQLGHARYELAGKTVGIVGLGDIGRATAERLGAFGVDLRYWSRRRRDADEEQALGASWSELDDLIAATDVLVLTVALTPQTRGLLSEARIATMRPEAVVVNAARGEVADEDALAVALAEGRLHAVATDVFSTEPAGPDHPLVAAERTTVTPHLGGATAESVGRIFGRSLANVSAALSGGDVEGLLGIADGS